MPTSLALLPSQVVGSAYFLPLGSGGLCATCVVHNEQHVTASPSHTHLPPHRQVLENVSVTHFNEDMYLDDTCEFQFHARDSCVCVSATADTDTGCVLVTADGLGVVCWWMFDGDGDGNRAQCLRPVMMSQPCRLPDTRVPHHLTALLRSGDPQ